MRSFPAPKPPAAAASMGPVIAALVGAAGAAHDAAGHTTATSAMAGSGFATTVAALTLALVIPTGRTDDVSP